MYFVNWFEENKEFGSGTEEKASSHKKCADDK